MKTENKKIELEKMISGCNSCVTGKKVAYFDVCDIPKNVNSYPHTSK